MGDSGSGAAAGGGALSRLGIFGTWIMIYRAFAALD